MKIKNFSFISLYVLSSLWMCTFHLSLVAKQPINSLQAAPLINHVKASIERAEKGTSNVSQEILKLRGMSSNKVRHLLNNLCSYPGTSYLEIGTWKGSTFISALYKNNKSILQAVAIDNWSKFGGPKDEFRANCAKFLPNFPFKFVEADSFQVNLKETFSLPVNVYFYDGDHSQLSQELAFTYYNSMLDDVFIAIVDDWNRPEIQTGTREAFKKLNYKILFEVVLPAYVFNDANNWWNGIYLAVISKQ